MSTSQLFGLQKTTLLDYPGKVASVLFTRGCNLKCPYCHNPDLVNFSIEDCEGLVDYNQLLHFLKLRKKVLGGVVISGGEPLVNFKTVKKLIEDIHSLGLKVKLDTNGTFPNELKKLNPDYIAMDIKSSLKNYNNVGYSGKAETIRESIKYIIGSGIEHEFRTTMAPDVISIEDMESIANDIKGCDSYFITQFNPENTLDPNFSKIVPYPISILSEAKEIMESKGIPCFIR